MLSFWEKNSFIEYDTIIIGSGIVGLSAACSLLEKNKNLKILILERGVFPAGASTRNAGFACYGSAAEIFSDIQIAGEEKALQLIELRKQGLEKLLNRLSENGCGYIHSQGGELILNKENFEDEKIDYVNSVVKNIFGTEIFFHDDKKISEFGFNKNIVKKYIHNIAEGQVDTGLMMRNLLQYATRLGVYIISGTEVEKIEHDENKIIISVRDSVKNSAIKFMASKAAVCTNAFTKVFFPELDVVPGRGQVIVTKPLQNLKFKGIFHFDEGYFYFRNYNNRIIFGGGRNLDFDGETSDEFLLTEKIQNALERNLQEIILPEQDFEIDIRWSGIMAFGKDKFPILKQVHENLFVACRMNGMGVAIGSKVGEQLAEMIL